MVGYRTLHTYPADGLTTLRVIGRMRRATADRLRVVNPRRHRLSRPWRAPPRARASTDIDRAPSRYDTRSPCTPTGARAGRPSRSASAAVRVCYRRTGRTLLRRPG